MVGSGGTSSSLRRCWLARSAEPVKLSRRSAARQRRPSEGGGTLVIGKSFDLVTMDPGRMFETTGSMIIPAMYDTLLTFENNDVSEPMPGLAESWEASEDATEFTFTLRDDAVFSDGSPVEAADVAFSLNRVRELKGNGSFLMEGVTAEAVDASTVGSMSEQPNPALPRILPTPTLGIVNSDVVIENGGTDQPGADTDDTAEEFLNSTSAGSGPYMLESFSTTSETVVARNPGVRRTDTGDVRPHRVPQQRRDDAGDRRAERQRRHRHGPRQRPARTAARRRGPDDRRDGLADDLLPVRQRQPGDLRGDVEPGLRRGGALRPRLRRHPRARRRRRRAGSRA